MPRFRHIPTGRIIKADTHEQANRFRASHRMEEILDPDKLETLSQAQNRSRIALRVRSSSVSQVLHMVGDNVDWAQKALEAEREGKNRKTLVRALEKLTGA